jgi:hypothetical protein
LRDDVDVVVEVDVRVLAADHVDLGEAGELVLRDRVLDELLGVSVYASSCFCVTANAQNLHFTRQTFVWFR